MSCYLSSGCCWHLRSVVPRAEPLAVAIWDGRPWLGGIGVLVIIMVLAFFGRRIVENSMVIAVIALGLVLGFLFVGILARFGSELSNSFVREPLTWDGTGTGLTYALTNCGFLPLLLYAARDLESRRETLIAAICAALVGVVPAIGFHFCFMTAYPQIVDRTLPGYWLIESIMSPTFLIVYVIVVFILVAQTGVALMQGVVEAIDKLLIERRGKPLTGLGHAILSGGALTLAAGLASIGLVALIVRAYGFLSISFLLVFFVPLFARGTWLVFRGRTTARQGR